MTKTELGKKLVWIGFFLFLLHLVLPSHYEAPFLRGDGTTYLGYETTLFTFRWLAFLPILSVTRFIASGDSINSLGIIGLWLLPMLNSLGNIMLLITPQILSRLRSRKTIKRYIFLAAFTTIATFLYPSIGDYRIGHIVWFLAHLSVLIGLRLYFQEYLILSEESSNSQFPIPNSPTP